MNDKELMITPDADKPTWLAENERIAALADEQQRHEQQRALSQRIGSELDEANKCWVGLWGELRELNGLKHAQGKILQDATRGKRARLSAYLKEFEDSFARLSASVGDYPEAPDYREALNSAQHIVTQIDAALYHIISNPARGRERLIAAMQSINRLPDPAGLGSAGRRRAEANDLIYRRAAPMIKAHGRRWSEIAAKLCEQVSYKQHAEIPLDTTDQAIVEVWLKPNVTKEGRAEQLRKIFSRRSG